MIQTLYKCVLQPALFSLDAEVAHNAATAAMGALESVPWALDLISPVFEVEDKRLHVNIRSLSCTNPVGLAAGFDKNAELLNVLPAFGFGFIEVGTFTPLQQEGHKKPRLFRYKQDHALVNRMGFNNPGVKVAAERIAKRWESSKRTSLGVNIGKGRDTPLEEAVEDYLTGLDLVLPYADYVVLNVSSPNTPQLRHLQQADSLQDIVKKVSDRARKWSQERGEAPKLIFTKVSPDCTDAQLEEIARIAMDCGTGLVATNTTIDFSRLKTKGPLREGGVSGAPVREKSNNVIRKLFKATRGVVPIIGVGGVFSAEDAYEKIRCGASLVQVYTGWIYEGPGLVPEINRGLLKLLERDGFRNIKEAVGTLN